MLKNNFKKIMFGIIIVLSIITIPALSKVNAGMAGIYVYNPSVSSVYEGGTVCYEVDFSGDIADITSSPKITLNGFTANIIVNKYVDRKKAYIYLTGIKNVGSSYDNKNIVIGRGFATSSTGLKSESVIPGRPFSIKIVDNERPVVSISEPSSKTIYQGGTVRYTVTARDNVKVTAFNLASMITKMGGFTADVDIRESGTTGTVTLSNIQGDENKDYSIRVALAAAVDANNNVSRPVVSPTFKIVSSDNERPVVSISEPSSKTVYQGGTIKYTVTAKDNVKVTAFNLVSMITKIGGFTADVDIRESGTTGTVTLSNIQGDENKDYSIRVALAAAVDANNNVSRPVVSPTFKIVSSDNERPVVEITGPSKQAVYPGEEVTYVVKARDNIKLVSFTLKNKIKTLGGFSADILVSGSGDTMTVTLKNIQGKIGSINSIKVLAGAAIDSNNNTSIEKVSNPFTIIEKCKPEPKPEPEVKPQPEPKPEPEVKPQPEPKPEPEVKPQPEPKPEIKPQPKPDDWVPNPNTGIEF